MQLQLGDWDTDANVSEGQGLQDLGALLRHSEWKPLKGFRMGVTGLLLGLKEVPPYGCCVVGWWQGGQQGHGKLPQWTDIMKPP